MSLNIKNKFIGLIAVAIIVVLLIIYYIAFKINVDKYEDFMYGLWVGDDQFCEESGIDTMLLFIGERDDDERQCYLVIKSGDKYISNQGFEMEYSKGSAGPLVRPYKIKAELDFDIDNPWGEDEIKFTFDIISGSLRIHDKDKLYAKLYKENSFMGMVCE